MNHCQNLLSVLALEALSNFAFNIKLRPYNLGLREGAEVVALHAEASERQAQVTGLQAMVSDLRHRLSTTSGHLAASKETTDTLVAAIADGEALTDLRFETSVNAQKALLQQRDALREKLNESAAQLAEVGRCRLNR